MKDYKIAPLGKFLILFAIVVFFALISLAVFKIYSHIPIMNKLETRNLKEESLYVYFPKHSPQFEDNQNPVLDKTIKDIQSDSIRNIYVIGNCEIQNSGSYLYSNGEHLLAQERAQNVANYLIKKGIPAYRIYVLENAAINSEKYFYNDRVEIYFK